MIKTITIRVEDEEIIMAITMIETIITTVIMIVTMMMTMRIKIGNHNKKRQNRIKSVQVKAIHVCLKRENVQKAMFYWNAKVTKCKYQKQSLKNKIKQ